MSRSGEPRSAGPVRLPVLQLPHHDRTQVLKWYKERNLDVTPVHPRETELQGIPAVRTLAELPNLSTTAVSVITAPPVRLLYTP
jgi:predicted CoA-binding protein